jgi:hypothetical protein
MVPDRFIDLEETGHLWMSGWRCMNCGHVVDAVTERNRQMQARRLVGVVNVAHPKGVSDMSVAAMTDNESQAA